MAHDDVELRILGALSEKERLTPDLVPLSTGALLAACNQRTARDPVMDLTEREVETALANLRTKGLVSTVQGVRDRVPKHRQRLMEALGATREEAALLTVLLLRGPQTPGELRSRCERYVPFVDVEAVVRTLDRMMERSPATVRDLGRSPGQSQRRFVHTLGVDEGRDRPRVRVASPSPISSPIPTPASAQEHGVGGATDGERQHVKDLDDVQVRALVESCLERQAALEARIADLASQVEALRAHVARADTADGSTSTTV